MNEHNPWQIIDATEAYSNQWITVTHYNVINPSGGKGIYGKVHFKNRAIGIVALDEHNNTYLVGQFRFPLNQYSWEIPEGGGPLAEDPLLAAQRELEEETGLRAVHWQPILRMHLSNSVSDEECVIFLAKNLSQHSAKPEETEDIVVKKIPFEEAYSMVRSGAITDAVAAAGILQVKLMMMEGTLQ
ncbi:MAG TPA: NUDIX hydrolase [Chitinophagaceae bacterium]|nr:NUDIX hydrolase [Chitinophagaceae bacterium]